MLVVLKMSNNRKIMEENKKKKLVVMGAGLAGSLAAVYMARRGYAVEVSLSHNQLDCIVCTLPLT